MAIKIPKTTKTHQLKYVLLDTNTAQQFRDFFNSDETKLSLAIYGDGTHKDKIDGKINLWGKARALNNNNIMKCFLVLSNDNEEMLGFVNIGLNSHGTYEFGTLFNDKVSKEHQTLALKDILVDYMQVNKAFLEKPVLIGTQSTVSYLEKIMETILVDRLQTTENNKDLARKILEIQENKGKALEQAGLAKLSLPPKPGFEEDLFKKLIAND